MLLAIGCARLQLYTLRTVSRLSSITTRYRHSVAHNSLTLLLYVARKVECDKVPMSVEEAPPSHFSGANPPRSVRDGRG